MVAQELVIAEVLFSSVTSVMLRTAANTPIMAKNVPVVAFFKKNKKEGKQDNASHHPVSTNLVIPITRVVQKHPNTCPDVFYFL